MFPKRGTPGSLETEAVTPKAFQPLAQGSPRPRRTLGPRQ